MDDSKFNLWRACFSFCFVDGFLDPKEEQWIHGKIKSLKFSPEQIETLMRDLKSPPDIDKLLPLITKPADRGFLVDQMRQLTRIDYEISVEEKAKIESIQKAVLSKIDLNSLKKQVAEDEHASYHEDEVYKVHNQHSYVERVFKGLMKILNPGDYKYPDNE